MADVIHHWSGRNFRPLFIVDNDKTKIDVMSGSVQAVGQKIADQIAGELRTRNQFIIDHFQCEFELQQTKLEALKAVLKIQDNLDANAIPLGAAAGLIITFNDGTKNTIVIQDITIDDWTFTLPGRTDRNKFKLPFRANVFKIL